MSASAKHGVVFHYVLLRFSHNEDICKTLEKNFRAWVRKRCPTAVEVRLPPKDGKDPGWSLFLFEKRSEAKGCCYGHESWNRRGVIEYVGEIKSDG